MAKSDDAVRKQKGLPLVRTGLQNIYKVGLAERADAPNLGEGQGDSGKKASINHSKNLPMTNNTRKGFKSKVIFDK